MRGSEEVRDVWTKEEDGETESLDKRRGERGLLDERGQLKKLVLRASSTVVNEQDA